MEDKREYRIPKHINQELRLGGLNTKGWIVVGGLAAISLTILLLLPHHHVKTLLYSFIILALPPVAAFVFLSDERSAESIYLAYYYSKHKATIRWESEPNAILKAIGKNRNSAKK